MGSELQNIQTHIASRVGAIVLAAIPLAGLALAFERQDRHALEEYNTYPELRAHLESGLLDSYWAGFGLVILAGFAYVALIECVAFVLRLAFRRAKGRVDQPAA